MRFLVKVTFPVEPANQAIKDPNFGSKMKQILGDMKAEAAYFSTMNGQRGGYIIVSMDDVSKMSAIAEPFFLWMKADVEFHPVMTPDDLMKGGPGIEAAIKKWG
ncbi:MAG: DUF3303 family protein [Bacteroidota bacterium]